MFYFVSFCTVTITVTYSLVASDYEYHYDIWSVGSNFTLILMPKIQIELNATAFLYLYTAESKDVLVTMTLHFCLTSTPKTMNIKIPAKSIVNLTLAPDTDLLLKSTLLNIEYINFQSPGTNFGLNVFLYDELVHISAFVAVPNRYWGHAYLVPSYKNFLYEIALNIHPKNKIYNFCMDPSLKTTYSSDKNFEATTLTMCAVNETVPEVAVTGIVAENGSREFGVLAYLFPSFLNEPAGCRSLPTAIFATEMPIPDGALGTEFITITTGVLSGTFVIAGRQTESINVVEYIEGSRKWHDINSTSEFIQLEMQPGPRRIKSSHPVQVILIILDECINGTTVGDASMTVLMPLSLLYNDYFIGIPVLLDLKHFIAVVLPENGLDGLILNYNLINNVTWIPVIGSEEWLFGEKSLTDWSNRVLSEFPFACYVYGIGNYMAYIHTAGYSSIKLMEDEFEEWLSHWEEWHCPTEFPGGRETQTRVCMAEKSSNYYQICLEDRMTTRWRDVYCPNLTGINNSTDTNNSTNITSAGLDSAVAKLGDFEYKNLIWVVVGIFAILCAVAIFSFPFPTPKVVSESTAVKGMQSGGVKPLGTTTYGHHWT